MHLTIKPRYEGAKPIEFFCPDGGGCIRIVDDRNPGRFGRQICEGGYFLGETLTAGDWESFERECRRWYRAYRRNNYRYLPESTVSRRRREREERERKAAKRPPVQMPPAFTHPQIVKSFGDVDGRGKTHVLASGWKITVTRSGGRFGLVTLDIVSPDGKEFIGVDEGDLHEEILPGGNRYIKCSRELEPVAEIAHGLLHSPDFE